MRTGKHRFFAVLAAAMLLLTACGGESSGEDVAEAQLPYGATMCIEKDGKIAMEYDKRFLDGELVQRLSEYYYAIASRNAELYTAQLLPLYHDYELQTLYGGLVDDKDILNNTYAELCNYYGKEFDFSMISVSDVIQEDYLDADRDAVKKMLIDLAADQKVENFEQSIDKFAQIKLTVYLTDRASGVKKETACSINGTMYGVHSQGKWQLVYIVPVSNSNSNSNSSGKQEAK